MFGPIHHVGFVTRDLAAAEAHFRALGYVPRADAVVDDRQGVEILFLVRERAAPGEPLVELIRPTSEQSAVYGFTTRNEYPIHHVCFVSADIASDVGAARKLKFYVVQPPVPAPAIGGSLIAFLYGRGTGLYELVERPPF
jgi:hypothetical protein